MEIEIKVGNYYKHRHTGDTYKVTNTDGHKVIYKMLTDTILFTTEVEVFGTLFVPLDLTTKNLE